MKGRSLIALSTLSIIFACEGSQQPTALRVQTDPSEIIWDGAHGGNRDFFFLPPLVPKPTKDPEYEKHVFNYSLGPSLVVEICALKSDELDDQGLPKFETHCDGTPVKTFGPGTVQLAKRPKEHDGWWTLHDPPVNGLYYVLWNTAESNLTAGDPALTKFYRIKVRIDGSSEVLGFADIDPRTTGHKWKYSKSDQLIEMIDGAKLPIPFRVERGVGCGTAALCSSATITNGNPGDPPQLVQLDGGNGAIAGASFPSGWLPSGTQCPTEQPCPQSVVVTIKEVNTGTGGLGLTAAQVGQCHAGLPLIQFRGCFEYTTIPELLPFNRAGDQFAQDVTVAVCFELEGTTDPRKDFVELWASDPPDEPPHPLPDVSDVGILAAGARNCSTTPVIALESSNPLTRLASAGWRKVKGAFGHTFGIKTAYAVDLGLGGIVKRFSRINPSMTANIQASTSTELPLTLGATTTSTVRIVGSHHHADHEPSGIGGLTVTFTASGGTLSATTATTAADGTASVDWTMPATGPGPYTLTANGPVLEEPVTFTARPYLTAATVRFHVTDDDKDDDTSISLAIVDQNGAVVASAGGTQGGHWNDNTNHDVPLEVTSHPAKPDGTYYDINFVELPNGDDEFHFTWSIVLVYSDGTSDTYGLGSGDVDSDRNRITRRIP